MVEGRIGEGGNDSQDPCKGCIEEICSTCLELRCQGIGVRFQERKWSFNTYIYKQKNKKVTDG
jgi:hypothetical protein